MQINLRIDQPTLLKLLAATCLSLLAFELPGMLLCGPLFGIEPPFYSDAFFPLPHLYLLLAAMELIVSLAAIGASAGLSLQRAWGWYAGFAFAAWGLLKSAASSLPQFWFWLGAPAVMYVEWRGLFLFLAYLMLMTALFEAGLASLTDAAGRKRMLGIIACFVLAAFILYHRERSILEDPTIVCY